MDPSLILLPSPPRPGLYLIMGPHGVIPWALDSVTRSFSPHPVVWVDAANKFNAHGIAFSAQSVRKDPATVLSSFHVARPFTAYQLEAIVSEKLLDAVYKTHALFAVIADPLSLYQAAEGRDSQVRQSFHRFIAGVQKASEECPVVLLVPEPGPPAYFPMLAASSFSKRRLEITDESRQLQEVSACPACVGDICGA